MSDHTNHESNGNNSDGHPRGVSRVPDSNPLAVYGSNGHEPRTEPGQAITISFVLNALRRWWKVATPTGIILAALAGGLIWWSFEPTYEVSAWLRISPSYLVFPNRENPEHLVQTQIELIRSPWVLGTVLSEPEIASMEEVLKQEWKLAWLTKELSVKSVGRSEVVTISLPGPNEGHLETIVKTVVNKYFALRKQLEAERVTDMIALLEQERKARESDVERLRQNVRELAELANLGDPFREQRQSEGTTVPSELGNLQTRLTETEYQMVLLEAEITASGGTIPGKERTTSDEPVQVDKRLVDREIGKHPLIQASEAALAGKRAQLLDYETKLAAGKEDPLYQKLKAEIKADEERLEVVRQKARGDVAEALGMAIEGQRSEKIGGLEEQYASYRHVKDFLDKRVQEERDEMKKSSGDTVDLMFAQADLARAEDVFERILSRVTELRTEQGAPAEVRRMYAEDDPLPTQALELNPFKKVVLAALAGLFLPFGLVVLWERVIRRVSGARQLKQESQLPVVGEIARLPAGRRVSPGSSSRRNGHELRVFEESIDSLRTCLALSEPLKDVKVLAVTSAANNEGKTSVAVQLAVSCARASGELALLIDGDLRSPDIHRVLETRIEPGLAQVLSGDSTLEEAIITDWSKRVHILPAGKLRGTPHKLLGNGKLKSLLSEARPSYRYIILDTPPILAAGEALVFAKEADASLLCAMRDVSRLDQINTAHERLVGAGGNPIGTVLNGVPASDYVRRYGSYKYYRAET